MEAIILAGGFGTRLRDVVTDVPKPMAKVAGEPFLKHLFVYLKRQGIRRVILSVGYMNEVIREYFKFNYDDIEIVYSIEDEPLGTGGGIRKALAQVVSQNVFIVNGDTFFNVSLKELLDFHIKSSADITLSLKEISNVSRYGTVKCGESGKVELFEEKKLTGKGLINGGVYVMDKNIFDLYTLPERFSFEEFMSQNVSSAHISSIICDEYFIDIGIPDEYHRAQNELLEYL